MKFDYQIGQAVQIVPLSREGKILSIWITDTGAQYQVRYFDNAEAKTIYFFPDELRSATATTDNK